MKRRSGVEVVFNIFRACCAACLALCVLSFNQVQLSFQWTQVRDISTGLQIRNAWRVSFVCVCVLFVWRIRHPLLFALTVLKKGGWNNEESDAVILVSFRCPKWGRFIICFIVYFYNETGSWSSGGLESSSGKDTTFPITPWHKHYTSQT